MAPSTQRHTPRIGFVFSALVALASLSSAAVVRDAFPPEITAPAVLESHATELLVDTALPMGTGEPTLPVLWEEEPDLRRKQRRAEADDDGDKTSDSDSDKTTDESSKKTTATEDDKTTKSEKDTSTTVKATKTVSTHASGPLTTVSETASSTAAAATGALPTAFDMTPSNQFHGDGDSDACPSFVSNLFASPTYKDCYPLSLMLQTSTGLFDAERQLTSIVRVLDATCAADVDQCTKFFNDAATNLTNSANCKQEYDDGLTLVTQLYTGLRAYNMLYSASCLQNPDTDMYCFATAVTNTTAPSDYYLYSMPLGLALPGGSTPSCGWCTKQTMAIWHTASADRSQPIAKVYVDASQQVNTVCGPNVVNTTLAEAVDGAAMGLAPSSWVMIASVCAAVFLSSAL